MKRYTLVNSLSVAPYGSAYYIYDARLSSDPFVDIATRKVSGNVYSFLQVLLLNHVKKTARGSDELLELAKIDPPEPLSNPAAALDFLIEHGYLQEVPAELSREARMVASLTARFSDARAQECDRFDVQERLRHSSPHTFFNLPCDIDDQDVAVGLQGLPLVTMNHNMGSFSSPNLLRGLSREVSWLKTQQQGFYSEIVLHDNKPDILCRDLVIKDFGDLDFSGKSVAQILDTCAAAVNHLLDHNIRPLFFGGDHVIAFPLVKAVQQRVPDLHLLHLDAHNDLFYAKDISFRHSAPMSNLIRYTDLEKIFTFGVRTYFDHRIDNMEKFYRGDGSSDRVAIHNLMQTKKMIGDGDALRDMLRVYGDKPFYLTIDLDVLSDRDCQVSTTLGEGLSWHELLQFVVIAFEECNIIGCDVSEYNVQGSSIPYNNSVFLNSLMLLLIDRLGKNRQARPQLPLRVTAAEA